MNLTPYTYVLNGICKKNVALLFRRVEGKAVLTLDLRCAGVVLAFPCRYHLVRTLILF